MKLAQPVCSYLGLLVACASFASVPEVTLADDGPLLPVVEEARAADLVKHTKRLIDQIAKVDGQFARSLRESLKSASTAKSDSAREIQRLLDRYCLAQLETNNAGASLRVGPARPVLDQHCASTFLVKTVNRSGSTAHVSFRSDHAIIKLETEKPNGPSKLLGTLIEYRWLRCISDQTGKHVTTLIAHVDDARTKELAIEFQCRPLLESRRPSSDADLKRWLENMVWHHRYSIVEIQQATGIDRKQIELALAKFNISAGTRPKEKAREQLKLLPNPGGRHPRIGFLEGAIRPQRETKASVFLPWDDSSYVVVDAPEAIWSNLGLTYLAHTHVPTVWEREKKALEKLEWKILNNKILECVRTLPNGIEFGSRMIPGKDAIRMEMWLTNGTHEVLSDLRVQNCVMLKHAKEFNLQTNDNKRFGKKTSACKDTTGKRWVITAWQPNARPWGNVGCPCLHSDPQFPNTKPGATSNLRGWLSFYEGDQIDAELHRIETATGLRLVKNNRMVTTCRDYAAERLFRAATSANC